MLTSNEREREGRRSAKTRPSRHIAAAVAAKTENGGYPYDGQFFANADTASVFADRRSDELLARDLIKAIAGDCWDGKGEMLARVYAAIIKRNPNTKITRRRVRAFWHREAAVISYHEIMELRAVALEERATRDGGGL